MIWQSMSAARYCVVIDYLVVEEGTKDYVLTWGIIYG